MRWKTHITARRGNDSGPVRGLVVPQRRSVARRRGYNGSLLFARPSYAVDT
jgi:hypothetical protein